MKITFLGTGTSHGVPAIACDCYVCSSPDPRDNRLRTSLLIEDDDTTVVIDTGPDFRQQMLRAKVKKLDAVLFTHEHKDHTAGLDDVRVFSDAKALNVYATPHLQSKLKQSYDYIFSGTKYPGIPRLQLHDIATGQVFSVGSLEFLPFQVLHYKLPVMAFRVSKLAYITDANYIEDATIERLKGVEVLVLNALRQKPHISHYSLEEAAAVAEQIGAQQTYFVHMSHEMGLHQEVNSSLQPNLQLAHDGLTITL